MDTSTWSRHGHSGWKAVVSAITCSTWLCALLCFALLVTGLPPVPGSTRENTRALDKNAAPRTHPNHTGQRARAQWAHPTIDSVRGHLPWAHFPSPWISLFSSWASALRRAKYFTRECGASRVCIMAIDMEAVGTACIDAYQFALAYHFHDPSLYRGEVLCFNTIPESRLLAEIPAERSVPKSGPWSRLKVPEDLLTEAISTCSKRLSPPKEGEAHDQIVRDCEAVSCWLFDSIWSRSI